MKRVIVSIVFLMVIALSAEKIPTIGLIHPTPKQIRNIEVLFEKNYLDLRKIRIIGIYHELENENYEESRSYVAGNRLDYVDFFVIRNQVSVDQLFKQNVWTPQFREIFRKIDGIIFTGGMDLPPLLYSAEKNLLTEDSTPQRSFYEVSLLYHLLKGNPELKLKPFLEERPGFPLLAICLGMQTLNVALGGTLHQDIPTEIYGLATVEKILTLNPDQIHSSIYLEKKYPAKKDLPPHFHRLKITEPTSLLASFCPEANQSPLVLSSHHQCISHLSPDLLVVATSIDQKIIEAVQHKRFSGVLGVQFHPEVYTLFLKGSKYFLPDGKEISLYESIIGIEPQLSFYRNLWKWFSLKLIESLKPDRPR